MAKKLNVKTVWFNVSADVVLEDADHNVSVAKFDGEGASTKSKRELARTIRETYAEDGFTVLNVRNISARRIESVTTYVIDADNATILDACRAFGLNVSEIE